MARAERAITAVVVAAGLALAACSASADRGSSRPAGGRSDKSTSGQAPERFYCDTSGKNLDVNPGSTIIISFSTQINHQVGSRLVTAEVQATGSNYSQTIYAPSGPRPLAIPNNLPGMAQLACKVRA